MYIVNPKKHITLNLKCKDDEEFSKKVNEIKLFFKNYDVETNIIECYTICDDLKNKIYTVIVLEKEEC